MGGKQYVYSEGDAAWFATFLARCERQSKGYIGLSLTNFTTSTVCAIAEGSVLEINGAIFIFSADTSITGSIATGLNYIVLSVTDTTTEPYWTSTVASYDTAKQGYYSDSERYVAGSYYDGSKYLAKFIFDDSKKGSHTRIFSFCPDATYKTANTANVVAEIQFSSLDATAAARSSIRLPDAMIITSFASYCTIDTGATVVCSMGRVPHTGASFSTMASNSHKTGGEIITTTVINPVIDNDTYKYMCKFDYTKNAAVAGSEVRGLQVTGIITRSLP